MAIYSYPIYTYTENRKKSQIFFRKIYVYGIVLASIDFVIRNRLVRGISPLIPLNRKDDVIEKR